MCGGLLSVPNTSRDITLQSAWCARPILAAAGAGSRITSQGEHFMLWKRVSLRRTSILVFMVFAGLGWSLQGPLASLEAAQLWQEGRATPLMQQPALPAFTEAAKA